jgi:hypothetical protein
MGLIVNIAGIVGAGLLSLSSITFPIHALQEGEYATVGYCELIRNPDRYNGKRVRISAVYRYGYEWSELYCLECATESKTWVEFTDSFSSSAKESIRKKLDDNGFKGRTLLVTMVGKFDAGGGYGHMGAYRLRLHSFIRADYF